MDDIINRRNKNEPDDLFQKRSNNHPNMEYTVEVKPEIFLDTKIVYSNDVITTEVKRNDRKFPVQRRLYWWIYQKMMNFPNVS